MITPERIPYSERPGGGVQASPLTEMEQYAEAAAPVWPAYLATAAVYVLLAWNHLPRMWLALWAVIFVAHTSVRGLLFHRYGRLPQAQKEATADAWRKRFAVVMLGYGALQSVLIPPAIAAVPEANAMWLTFVIFFGCALVSALMPLSALSLRLYLAITLVPTALAWAFVDGEKAWLLPVVLVVAAVLCLKLGRDRLAEVRQRHDLTRRLAQSVEQLRRSNMSRTRMIMEASHDLRQPAHALSMMAERLRQATPGADLQACIADMEHSIASLTDMLGELMEFSQLDLGEYSPHLEAVDLRALLVDLEARFAPGAARKSLRWRSSAADVRAMADPWLLRRVIDNAVSNAVRYTVAGTVSVMCEARDGRAVLRVQDTGPGIAADDIERAFMAYVRLPRSAGEEPGRGLGLAFARRAAEAMGGRLELVSRPGHGTTVTLSLDAAPVCPASADAPAVAASLPLADRHLLLVENDVVLRRSMQDVLVGWGATVDAVGEVAAIDALVARPTLVLADLHLDGTGNGFDAIARVRARHPGAWIPAILVTGDTDPDMFEQARRQGIDVAYKPVRPSRLRQMIDDALVSTRAPD
ncbi:MAG: hybrid sensor histidine kinase/response regulator [Burkholderiaceae bacterium]|nr:hybrid sensor histidine kinase/response regulator [Burkholderiaceae bacterium]